MSKAKELSQNARETFQTQEAEEIQEESSLDNVSRYSIKNYVVTKTMKVKVKNPSCVDMINIVRESTKVNVGLHLAVIKLHHKEN